MALARIACVKPLASTPTLISIEWMPVPGAAFYQLFPSVEGMWGADLVQRLAVNGEMGVLLNGVLSFSVAEPAAIITGFPSERRLWLQLRGCSYMEGQLACGEMPLEPWLLWDPRRTQPPPCPQPVPQQPPAQTPPQPPQQAPALPFPSPTPALPWDLILLIGAGAAAVIGFGIVLGSGRPAQRAA